MLEREMGIEPATSSLGTLILALERRHLASVFGLNGKHWKTSSGALVS
jgi:hypothetical protein